jgi:uncharacterized membrane protein YbhN (UPF0104 family)
MQHRIAVKLEPLSRGYSLLTAGRATESSGLSFVAWFVQIVVAVLAARAVGVSLPLGGLVMAVFAVNAASVFPLTPANVGVFQIAFLVALSAYGVERSSSLAVATVYQVALVIPVIVLGLIMLHRRSRSLGKALRGA